MNLSEVLEKIGFRRTIAPGRGDNKVQHGNFNSNFKLGARGPEALVGRYGIKIDPSAGTFDGEAKPDPSVIAQWLASRHDLGGVEFLGNAARAGLIEQANLRDIEPPDDLTNTDMMLISRDGQTTAYQELLLPWLKATNGGQEDAAASTEKLATTVEDHEQRLRRIEAALAGTHGLGVRG